MNERENALHVIKRDGLAQWIPAARDCLQPINPTDVVAERPPYAMGIGGSGYDYFGCWWEYEEDIKGASPIPGREPCTDITKWKEQITFPDIDKIDWSKAAELTSTLDYENKLIIYLWESGPWERLHALLGFQPALEAIYEEPEAFEELMQAITEFRVKMVAKIKEYYHPDIILNMDDMGYQHGQFVSNEMYREFLMPYDKAVGDAVKANGMIYAYHSCGKVDGLFDDIMETGPEMLLSLFYPYNDQEKVLEKYAGKVIFDGPNWEQMLSLESTTEEMIREEARRVTSLFGPSGSLIFDAGAIAPAHAEIFYDEFYKIRDQYNPYK